MFSQYLRHIPVPFPVYSRHNKLRFTRVYIFQILPVGAHFSTSFSSIYINTYSQLCSFSEAHSPFDFLTQVLLGIVFSWLICYILTAYDVFPTDPQHYGYRARTDLKKDVISKAPWVTFPYPGKRIQSNQLIRKLQLKLYFIRSVLISNQGQWGVPTVSLAGAVGILAGVISSMIESVGDYHACARLSGAPPPPKHAINRGIGMEGLGCLLAGAWGTGNGTTSYSENVGALGITKVEATISL